MPCCAFDPLSLSHDWGGRAVSDTPFQAGPTAPYCSPSAWRDPQASRDYSPNLVSPVPLDIRVPHIRIGLPTVVSGGTDNSYLCTKQRSRNPPLPSTKRVRGAREISGALPPIIGRLHGEREGRNYGPHHEVD